MKKPLRILVALIGAIGDSLMTLALFDDVLSVEKDAKFLVITRRNTKLIADLARAYPQVEVREIAGNLRSIPLYLYVFTKRWTLLALGVALHYSFQIKCFFFALGISGNRTVGLDDRLHGERHWLPLQVAVMPKEKLIIGNFRRLLQYVDGFSETTVNELMKRPPLLRIETSMPKEFQYEKGRYFVVHLFGNARYRSFPIHRWISLLGILSHAYPTLPIIFTGSEKDRVFVQEVADAIPNAHVFIDYPILEVAWLVDNAVLYIGVDTGITHLAGVLNKKSLILGHLGETRWLALYNPNARILVNSVRCICSEGRCYEVENGIEYRRCLYDISDEAFFSSVTLALSSPQNSIPLFAGLFDENRTNSLPSSFV